MKIKGIELNAFIKEAWPGIDWYWNHDLFDDYANPDVVYDTEEMSDLFWQGAGYKESLSLDLLITQWRKSRSYTDFIVTIPKHYVDHFKQYIASIQGTIR